MLLTRQDLSLQILASRPHPITQRCLLPETRQNSPLLKMMQKKKRVFPFL